MKEKDVDEFVLLCLVANGFVAEQLEEDSLQCVLREESWVTELKIDVPDDNKPFKDAFCVKKVELNKSLFVNYGDRTEASLRTIDFWV